MKKIILILIIPVIFFIVGCKRELEYEFLTHGDTLYRLEKRSGKISVVENSKIITLEESTTDIVKENITVLNTTKTWHKINLKQYNIILSRTDTIEVSLRTRWRDGNLYFIFTMKRLGMPGAYSGIRYFLLRLLDSDGFIIIEKRIDIDDMNILVDEQGKHIGMGTNSRIPCTAETYLSIEDWSCGWKLF
jgi:hypothetical protein